MKASEFNREAWKYGERAVARMLAFYRPAEEKIALERALRGKQELGYLFDADWVVVSWGKSGRTWLRVMLSRYYKLRYNLKSDPLIRFDNFHHKNQAIPKIFFTHDNYLRDYTGNHDDLRDFYDKKVVFLARDPRDVVTSQYFQWKHRMRQRKKYINKYPQDDGLDVFNFMLDENQGLSRIIRFMNHWAKDAAGVKSFLLVRYETLRSEPEETLGSILEFFGDQNFDRYVRDVITYADFKNMRVRESKTSIIGRLLTNTKVAPRSKNNPDSFKTRKGKVGGFKDYLNEEQIAQINQMMKSLNPIYGYSPD